MLTPTVADGSVGVQVPRPFSDGAGGAPSSCLLERPGSLSCAHLDDAQRAITLRFGELLIDTGRQEAYRAGRSIGLTPKGYRLLVALLSAAPKLVSRSQLAAEIEPDCSGRFVDIDEHIHALRDVLDIPFAWPMIVTIGKLGYRLADAEAR